MKSFDREGEGLIRRGGRGVRVDAARIKSDKVRQQSDLPKEQTDFLTPEAEGTKGRFHPLVLLWMSLLFPLDMMFSVDLGAVFFCFLVPALCMISLKRISRLIKFSGAFLFLILLCEGVFYLQVLGFRSYGWIAFLGGASYIFLKVIPMTMVASILFYDVSTSFLLSSLQMLGLPKNAVLSITVAFRFVPVFTSEMRMVRQTMQMRGLSLSLRHPFYALEYIVVPMLFRCLLLAEEMTSAGLTKGIESENKRSSLEDVSLKKRDWVGIILLGLISGFFIWRGGAKVDRFF